MQNFSKTVSTADEGKRLDVFLRGLIPDTSRSHLKKYILSNNITLNSRPAKAGEKLKAGDKILVNIPLPEPADIVPEDIPLKILYEDEDLIVVNKESGMVVHPTAHLASGTFVNALLYLCTDLSGIGGKLKPGIVHRLDKDTSGAIVAAKNDITHRALCDQFKAREVKKLYLALVIGRMKAEEGEINLPLGRHVKDRKKISAYTRKAREAITRWRVLKEEGGVTYLQINLITGRTHQIRVHLKESGHPIVGDGIYGTKKLHKVLPPGNLSSRIRSLNRPFLHASTLGFYHPAKKKYMEFTAPLPEELKEILDLMVPAYSNL